MVQPKFKRQRAIGFQVMAVPARTTFTARGPDLASISRHCSRHRQRLRWIRHNRVARAQVGNVP